MAPPPGPKNLCMGGCGCVDVAKRGGQSAAAPQFAKKNDSVSTPEPTRGPGVRLASRAVVAPAPAHPGIRPAATPRCSASWRCWPGLRWAAPIALSAPTPTYPPLNPNRGCGTSTGSHQIPPKDDAVGTSGCSLAGGGEHHRNRIPLQVDPFLPTAPLVCPSQNHCTHPFWCGKHATHGSHKSHTGSHTSHTVSHIRHTHRVTHATHGVTQVTHSVTHVTHRFTHVTHWSPAASTPSAGAAHVVRLVAHAPPTGGGHVRGPREGAGRRGRAAGGSEGPQPPKGHPSAPRCPRRQATRSEARLAAPGLYCIAPPSPPPSFARTSAQRCWNRFGTGWWHSLNAL